MFLLVARNPWTIVANGNFDVTPCSRDVEADSAMLTRGVLPGIDQKIPDRLFKGLHITKHVETFFLRDLDLRVFVHRRCVECGNTASDKVLYQNRSACETVPTGFDLRKPK